MNYTILIVTFNRLDKLRKCIQCAEKQTIKANHIVIIDNASTDGTKEFLNESRFNNDTYVIKRMKENMGGSGGFCVGVKEALKLSDDWVLLIDDDAMLRENYIEEITKYMEKDIYAYTGSVNEYGKINLSHRRKISIRGLYREKNIEEKKLKDESFEFDLASFCGLIINKKIIQKVGLPRGDFFIWYDDTEYSLRIRKYTKIKNINSAVLDHEVSNPKLDEKNSSRMNWKSYYGIRNRIYTIKHYGNALSLFYNLIFLYMMLFRYVLWKKSKNKFKKEIGENNCRIIRRAIKDGINEKLGKNEEFLP